MTAITPPAGEEVLRVARACGLDATSASRVGEGSDDIATFDVDDAWMFRFATSDAGVHGLSTERRVLPLVSACVDVRVPAYELEGHRRGMPWAGYRKIHGVSGEAARPERRHWSRLADQAAAFLSSIHAIPADLSGAHSVPVGGEWIEELPAYRRLIERRLPALVTRSVRPYLHGEIPRPPGPPNTTFCHADIKGEHLLVSATGSDLGGVIDWNDACRNDPAIDLAGVGLWLGPSFVHELALRYGGADAAIEARALWIARMGMLAGIGATLAGDDNWPIDLARRQLRWAFRDD